MNRSFLVVTGLSTWLLHAGCIDQQDAPPNRPNAGGGGTTASSTSTGGTPTPPGAVRLATWNLREFPLTAATLDNVVDIVGGNIQPDVLAVQEITSASAFQALADRLPDYEALLDEDDFGDLRLGMLYRPDRVTVTGTETWFPTNGFTFPRAPFVVDLDISGFDLRAVIIHLKARDSPEDRQRRTQAIAELANLLNTLLEGDGEKDYILLGDFNDELGDPANENVFGPFLDAPDKYVFLTEPLEQNNAYTYIPFKSMLDHVMITTDALDEYGNGKTQIVALETIVPSFEDQVSDHRPIIVDFQVDELSP